MAALQETVDRVRRIDVDQYRYGFETVIESDKAPKGLSEDTVRFISEKKNEPAWMLEWRLEAYRRWLTMAEPKWARVNYPKIDYQDLYYYAAPKAFKAPKSLDEVDPEILRTYEKLGIPLKEQKILAGVVEEPANGQDSDGEADAELPLQILDLGCASSILLVDQIIGALPLGGELGTVSALPDDFDQALRSDRRRIEIHSRRVGHQIHIRGGHARSALQCLLYPAAAAGAVHARDGNGTGG